ncbi:M23 family metallopeptidase [Salegentibacter salarius]|uniref:Peptidase M23 n=1 Tax=Salegentibacter salarius TaxID=435906 RepID=A0A2N0TVU9_9FLAO|nr:M23 family metallopeptidase [Salegentibacter salarius]OEY72590.1 peptidase M23 [Salegentibacter salarius]PKD18849.1 peptidase M23 [Salegentibacter salarius]SLK01822.1 Peptidase family M23 [Salegentibacter salarius]
MKSILAVFLLFISTVALAQSNVPKDYFQKPLEVPLVLSGTFGELRSNHFHSGLDIKTQQRQGLNVVASAKGYVSRINIQHYGYGKALYVQHPNGYTTVYAHLKEFSPEIEAYVKKRQYANETYEIELFPEAGELPVAADELIAFSGNTGGSGGPHLHFEIRDGSQRPMNPKLFGIEINDNRAPIIDGLYAYPLDADAHVNNSRDRQKINLIPLEDGSYIASEIDACGNIGFGVSSVDQQDGASNRNGVYQIEAELNGDRVFTLPFKRFSFAESRHLNQLIDYEYYSKNKKRVQKLFVENGNPLSLYEDVVNKGELYIQDSLNYNYTIKVSDFAGNERIIRVPIQGMQRNDIPPKKEEKTDYFAQANQPFAAEANGMDIYIPKGSLYQDTYLDIEFGEEKVKVHNDHTPLHTNITIGFDVSAYSAEEKDKLFIARLGYNDRPNYSSTYKKANRFTTRTRTFGEYTLASDVTPPKIWPTNFNDGQWISNNNTLQVKISDDLSGIKSYRATVNGKFILMEYEYKNNTLTHDFSDGVVTETENKLKIIVTDNVGNSNTYEATFFRKNS